ncbi:MAG TPA: phosphate acetyltransferase [Bryobacteraceae bacterium]|jgi:phosphate acetyltransferase|nr:phosphate acetyltransferase [Bryobacteraceae bacterium]
MSLPESAALFLARQTERLRRLPKKKRIVFPEGTDKRVQEAAARLAREGLIEPILIGAEPKSQDAEKYAALYFERRRSKGLTLMEAQQVARQPLYVASLMVAAGDADGAVGGAVNTTAETVRAALHCIGPAVGVRTVSGVFFVCVQDRGYGHDGVLAFADCGLVIDPSAVEVAEIAIATAHSTRTIIGAEPKVALLSFSTKGSAKHPFAEKMIEALRILRERAPDLDVDGELQADAALVPSVGSSKAPGSTVAGHANTLIFPDLASGNIAYKLVERLGNGAAYGPFLQGLAKPVNDLSRGCSADDVYGAAIVTALQSEGA